MQVYKRKMKDYHNDEKTVPIHELLHKYKET